MLVLIVDVEIFGKAGTVVREDKVFYDLRQVGFLRHLHTLGHMTDNDACALLERHVVMGVHARLVLGKEHGVRHLAYVVVERAGAHKQRVGADLVGNLRREVTHGY